MLSTTLSLLPAGIINGLMFGAIYALVALGLTLIYGVLHIINFAHGAMLMIALYSAYFLFKILKASFAKFKPPTIQFWPAIIFAVIFLFIIFLVVISPDGFKSSLKA